MKIQYIEKTKFAYFNGYKFVRDDKTGYYLGTSKINGKRRRLHRYVWEYYKGEIPKGYDIHHKDHNKSNNEIENLELLTTSEHKKRHAKELTEEQIQKLKNNLETKARPKAIEWHKSQEGLAWHKEQYKISLGAKKKHKFICEYCGKEYEAYKNKINRFCSKRCMTAWRRKSGIDDIERICVSCNRPFMCNKYSKMTKCIDCTPERYRKKRLK